MQKILLLISFILLLTVGCSQQQNNTETPEHTKQITKVQITCMAECKSMYPDQAEVQTFKDKETIELFATAIQNAVRMPGEMDYSILYEMLVTYDDNTTDLYYLNVEKQKENIGFLVNTSDTHIGYSIPKEYNDKLSELLYK
ncbi:hypothetical protein [Bacillus alkalisoli]|uniref:hypothetical protein n=1 Tax=Bacillus alkalisoli TaxID=2011008 RepID=UPI000C238F53|nr:hypothetical protein [Bacillus alkalisoli]